jgi:hypothetical protein
MRVNVKAAIGETTKKRLTKPYAGEPVTGNKLSYARNWMMKC